MSEEGTVTEVGEASAGDPAMEAEARLQGWVSKEEWRHDPEEWTDAETFVKRGREINPILRKSLEKERRERQKIEQELAELKGTVKDLAEYRQRLEKTVYDRAMADLKKQRKAAYEAGDFEAASQVDEAMDEMRTEQAKPAPKGEAPATPAKIDPRVSEWMERNRWYNDSNEEMVDYANAVAQRMVRQNGGKPLDFDTALPEIERRVKAQFPAKFGTTPAMYEGTGSTGQSAPAGRSPSGGKGFASLPADAKKEFERFYSAGYYPTHIYKDKAAAQAQYFSDYE